MGSSLRKRSLRLGTFVVSALAGVAAVAGLAAAEPSEKAAAPDKEVTVLPEQRIEGVPGQNPTDDALRQEFQQTAECIRATGLTVRTAKMDIEESGDVNTELEVSLGDSGFTFDESSAHEARCGQTYTALVFARGDAIHPR